jgi:uncharacterized protein YgiM (DUF1202 family)
MHVSKFSRLLMMVMLLIAAGLACSFPGTTSEEMPPEGDSAVVVATRVAATMAAGGVAEVPEGAALPPASSEAPPPAAAPTDATSPTVTQTPTDTLTPTPAVPMVSVTLNTNCRFGPGLVYEYLGALLEGETAEIHGVNPGGNFWYIENPDNPGEYCWITAAYALVTGDTSQVPVLTPPPTPTHTPVPLNFNLSNPIHLNCGGNHYIEFAVTNTGPQTFWSFDLHVEDLDTSVVKTTTGNCFKSAHGCVAGIVDWVDPGGEAYLQVGSYAYDPFGHQVRTTAKICSEANQSGICVTKTYTNTVTGVSDVAQKENRDPVEERQVLDRLLEIPIETWNYIAEPDAIRHMGPMAQDFFEAYGLGADDRLSAMDVQGVALASIQALHEIVQEKDAQIVELEARLTELEGSMAMEASAGFDYLDLAAGFVTGVSLTLGAGWYWKRRRVRET